MFFQWAGPGGQPDVCGKQEANKPREPGRSSVRDSMASILKGVVSVFAVTACSGVYSIKPRLPETSIETASTARIGTLDVENRNRSIQSVGSVSLTTTNRGGSATSRHAPQEENSIQPVDTPFIQESHGGLRNRRQGITLLALGEPKSGTTWTGRMVPELAIKLCGSYNNLWCQLGGVVVTPHNPAPCYEFELLNTTTNGDNNPELFLHFDGRAKHIIPGMDQKLPEGCRNGGRQHKNSFMDLSPCERDEVPTRQGLNSCLWKTSEQCVSRMSSVGPSITRSIVIMRDPRNVVISEYKMRIKCKSPFVVKRSLEEFVNWKFEVIVSWMHQRYMWHTAPLMEASTHIEFYEDLQESHRGFIGIAGFMGLECSEAQAYEAWNAHKQQSPDRGYGTHGLSVGAISFMNTTMARLLPPALALRWQVRPIEH